MGEAVDVVLRRAGRADRGRVLTELAAWVQATFGHAPADPALFRRAVTHGSLGGEPSYERLEFLGDRVLGLAVAEWLYAQFADEDEGTLSRRLHVLVSGATCAAVAREIGLPDQLRLGKGARATTVDSDHVLGDVVEALLGALYLEAGLDAARAWVRRHWAARFGTATVANKHPKAALQEWAEANRRGRPRYLVEDESGPDHARVYTVAAVVGDAHARATASTKREAESVAATALLGLLTEAEVPRRKKRRGVRAVLPAPAEERA